MPFTRAKTFAFSEPVAATADPGHDPLRRHRFGEAISLSVATKSGQRAEHPKRVTT